jgi:hypothetical protein
VNEQVAELAAEGYSEFKIASVLALKVQTVKDMLCLEEVKALINTFKLRPREEVLVKKYEKIEDKALTVIEENVSIVEVPIALKILDTITRRREVELNKVKGSTPPLIGSITLVNISLPERLVPTEDTTLTLNEQGEIVSVGGRSFAPLSANGVQEIFSKVALRRKAIHGLKVEDF